MKATGYVLLVLGFLLGAFATALDVEVVDWPLFGLAALAAVAGVLMVKRAASAHATSDAVLELNRGELRESIDNIVRDIRDIAADKAAKGAGLREVIDQRLRIDLADQAQRLTAVGSHARHLHVPHALQGHHHLVAVQRRIIHDQHTQ